MYTAAVQTAPSTVTVLDPAECEMVECPWPDPPMAEPGVDVTVVADSAGTEGECLEVSEDTLRRHGIELDRGYRIVEGESRPQPLELKPMTLGVAR